jgi:hypothetical protein
MGTGVNGTYLSPLSLEGEGWGEGVNAYHCRKNHPSP